MFTTTPDSAIDETEPSPFPAGCVFISSGAPCSQPLHCKRHALTSLIAAVALRSG